MFNLATNLESAAAEWPDREAIVFDSLRMNYRALEVEACRVANGLAQAGIGRGDHVALACPNRPEFISAYFGILKLGAVVVCVSALLRAREIAWQLDHSDAKALIAYGGGDMSIGTASREAFDQVQGCRKAWFIRSDGDLVNGPDTEPFEVLIKGQTGIFRSVSTQAEDTAVILYTSGTTGKPKGAELTHANFMLNVATMARERPVPEGGGRSLVVLPMFHIMAQTCIMHLGIFSAGLLVLMQRFDPAEAVRLILAENISGFAGVPTMYRAVLDCPDITPEQQAAVGRQLVTVSAGGASVPPELQREFLSRFDTPMTNGYGATETSPVSCFHQGNSDLRLGSIGTAAWGVELRVVDDTGRDVPVGEAGELLVRGHCVMKGYYKDPEATALAIRDGWYHSGDLARMDEDSYVYIVGRKKEMIIRGGFNVYPAEVEASLMEHPDIGQAAVIGVPHDRNGEEVMAFVTPLPGHKVEPNAVIAWAREAMASHK
ncbi:MAG: AMP-binding protein, partial [Alphaproteobacteria bacterium]